MDGFYFIRWSSYLFYFMQDLQMRLFGSNEG